MAFDDEDCVRDRDQKRYISGYVHNIFGGEICWMKKILFAMALLITNFDPGCLRNETKY